MTVKLSSVYSSAHLMYIDNRSLDAYGNAIIRDFAPELLIEPQPVNIEAFIGDYLGLPEMEYQRLSLDGRVHGMTAFDTGLIEVIHDDTNKPKKIPVKAGTILIDISLADEKGEHRRRFTTMHEASHWLLHRSIPIPTGYDPAEPSEEGFMMERQVDFLASTLLMPLSAVRIAFRNYFAFYAMKPRQIVRNASVWDNLIAAQLPEYLEKTFNVSPEAAMIRLEKLNALVDGEPMKLSV